MVDVKKKDVKALSVRNSSIPKNHSFHIPVIERNSSVTTVIAIEISSRYIHTVTVVITHFKS